MGFPDFDASVLAELRDATDDATVLDIIALFRADAPRVVADMKTASAANDSEAIRKAAHRLKGASATLGLHNAQHLCHALEQAAKSGSMANASAMIEDLEASLARGLALALAKPAPA